MRLLACVPLVVLFACGNKSDGADTGGAVGGSDGSDGGGDATCSSGSRWTGGNEESPLMHPGMDCIACHTAEGEGPRFTAAGTVQGALGDDDDCDGVQGLTVEITDADGVVFSATTNAAGNFFFSEPAMAFPIQARVIDGDQVNEMMGSVGTGACASCHTAAGANGAPGRVLAP